MTRAVGRTTLLTSLFFALLGVVGAGSARGQEVQVSDRPYAAASPYLPLDNIGYALIDALQSRGGLTSLSLLERPYTINAIGRALQAETALQRLRGLQSP